MTEKERKQKYFDKKKAEATLVKCACGCGTEILDTDDYGRPRIFVSGHNTPRKYEDKYGHKKAWMNKNRNKLRGYKRKASRARKIKLITSHDSKCLECGVRYNGANGSIFHFHHTDPSEKESNISSMLLNCSMKAIEEEVAKCVMLCSNCHSILHQGEY